MKYRCDVCDLKTEKLQEYRHGTLFGRPMRLCEGCIAFLNHTKKREELAAQVNFGIDLNMPAGDGLKRVSALEQAFDSKHAGENEEQVEVERQALCRLRFYFENKNLSGN